MVGDWGRLWGPVEWEEVGENFNLQGHQPAPLAEHCPEYWPCAVDLLSWAGLRPFESRCRTVRVSSRHNIAGCLHGILAEAFEFDSRYFFPCSYFQIARSPFGIISLSAAASLYPALQTDYRPSWPTIRANDFIGHQKVGVDGGAAQVAVAECGVIQAPTPLVGSRPT